MSATRDLLTIYFRSYGDSRSWGVDKFPGGFSIDLWRWAVIVGWSEDVAKIARPSSSSKQRE